VSFRTLAVGSAGTGLVLVAALAAGCARVDDDAARRAPVSPAMGGTSDGTPTTARHPDAGAALAEPATDEAGLPPRVARPATMEGAASDDRAAAARDRRAARAALRKAFADVLRSHPRVVERLARGDAAPAADGRATAEATAPSGGGVPTAALVAALRRAVAAREASAQAAEGSAAPAAPPEVPRRMLP
jgi:hypothetical protein